MNEDVTYQVLKTAIDAGAREFVICAGSRNSSFVEALRVEERLTTYYWPEERSAAFFALGRSRLTHQPVAVITTSGTASGELLPAAMEAHYSGVPLILITTDRPRRFRGSGAPQSAEQVGLFGHYASIALDVAEDTPCDFSKWNHRGPIHVNVCLEEPQNQPQFSGRSLAITPPEAKPPFNHDRKHIEEVLNRFLTHANYPLIIVSALPSSARETVVNFLLKLGAPVFLEGISGLREDSRLQHLRIINTEKILESAKENEYPINGILRIGGIPTNRIWRDLEYQKNHIKVCSISQLAFSGLSWNRNVLVGPINEILSHYEMPQNLSLASASKWLQSQPIFCQLLQELFKEEPASEPALMHALSKIVPNSAHLYLGNSLPIREWDLAADNRDRGLTITASRGLNGIDGQLSTFLGLCTANKPNWAILGDLTALYDMAGYWIIPQLNQIKATIIVVNNGGGQLFSKMYPYKEMLNLHNLHFQSLASMWGLQYQQWESIPDENGEMSGQKFHLAEVIPDNTATKRFWEKFSKRLQQQPLALQIE